jgi:hypothetical protein
VGRRQRASSTAVVTHGPAGASLLHPPSQRPCDPIQQEVPRDVWEPCQHRGRQGVPGLARRDGMPRAAPSSLRCYAALLLHNTPRDRG